MPRELAPHIHTPDRPSCRSGNHVQAGHPSWPAPVYLSETRAVIPLAQPPGQLGPNSLGWTAFVVSPTLVPSCQPEVPVSIGGEQPRSRT